MSSAAYSFFSLKTQFENVGDALINREMIRLSALYGQAHVDLSRCPDSFKQTLGLDGTAVIYDGFVPLCKAMLACRLKGGLCYYYLSPGGYVGELELKHIPAKILNTLALMFFFLLGIRICLVGVSYERLGPRNIALQKIRTRLLYRHILRDGISLTYAQNKGMKTDGVMPDLAFNIFTQEPKALKNLKHPERVAFSFRVDQFAEQKEKVFDTVKAILSVLPKETAISIVSQVNRDRAGMQEMKSLIEKMGHTVDFTDGADSVDTCLAAYAPCDLVISNRLHSLLIGASVTGHLIAVTGEGKNRKIEGILEEIGCPDHQIAAGETGTDKLNSMVRSALSHSVDGRAQRESLQKAFQEFLV
jgi:polysaccharide pyruvyl transferase WcaK-like protein